MEFPKLDNGMVTGLLTQAERQSIATRLDEKGAPQTCECCGKRQWALGDHIVSPQSLARHPTHLRQAPADPFFPSVLLLCQNCGNSKLLNLLILGFGDELLPKGESRPE